MSRRTLLTITLVVFSTSVFPLKADILDEVIVSPTRNNRDVTDRIITLAENLQVQLPKFLQLAGGNSLLVSKLDSRILQALVDLGILRGFMPNYPVGLAEPFIQGEVRGDIPGNERDKNWGLSRIAVERAWQTTMGDEDLIVALLDTGLDLDHPDIVDNLWTNHGEIPDNGRDDDGNGYIDDVHGFNFCNRTGKPEDDMGHGSHTAGVIGAVENDIGTIGVAPKVRIMPLKFLECANGTVATAIEAIHYAVDNGAVVINNSWGIKNSAIFENIGNRWGGSSPIALYDAIEYANDMGVVFIASSGNFRSDNDIVRIYPAGLDNDNLISVTSTDSDDRFHREVNYGTVTVHVAAPGLDIFSLWMNDDYNTISGTSMAAPFVSGLAALILASDPDLTPVEVKERIINSVDRKADLASISLSGGRINAARAIEMDFNPDPVDLLNPGKDCEVFWVDPGCGQAVHVGENIDINGYVRACNDDYRSTWTILTGPNGANPTITTQTGDPDGIVFRSDISGSYKLEFCAGAPASSMECDSLEIKVVDKGDELPVMQCRENGICLSLAGHGDENNITLASAFLLTLLILSLRMFGGYHRSARTTKPGTGKKTHGLDKVG